MIRIRKNDGSIIRLNDDFRFVEICDEDDNVAQVSYADARGKIVVFDSSDKVFTERYKGMFGVKFCDIKRPNLNQK